MAAGSVTSKVDQRENPRVPFVTTIMIETYPTSSYYEGRMVNHSRGGMCFESDFAPEVDSEVFIGIESSPYSPNHDVFRAKVVWVRELAREDSYYIFGVGVKYR